MKVVKTGVSRELKVELQTVFGNISSDYVVASVLLEHVSKYPIINSATTISQANNVSRYNFLLYLRLPFPTTFIQPRPRLPPQCCIDTRIPSIVVCTAPVPLTIHQGTISPQRDLLQSNPSIVPTLVLLSHGKFDMISKFKVQCSIRTFIFQNHYLRMLWLFISHWCPIHATAPPLSFLVQSQTTRKHLECVLGFSPLLDVL